MVLDMESDDSRASSQSNSSESRSNSPTNDKEEVAPEQGDESIGGGGGGGPNQDRSARAPSTSSSSSNSSSSSSRSDLSKKQKKSSSSSSGSGSGSSSSSGSSSDEEGDQEPVQEQQRLAQQQHEQQQQQLQNERESNEAESESAAVTPVEAEHPGSPSAKSQPSSFLSSVRSRSNSPQLYNQAAVDLNISHEDLSDVSDLEGEEKRAPSKNSLHPADEIEDDAISNDSLPTLGEEDDVEQKQSKQNGKASSGDEIKTTAKETHSDDASNGHQRAPAPALEEDLVKTHDDDALDFEAEEGECPEQAKEPPPMESKANESNQAKSTAKVSQDEDDDDGEVDCDEEEGDDNDKRKDGAGNGSLEDGEEAKGKASVSTSPSQDKEDDEELEEGEVSDEDEKRPEETEPKPVCRFYTRGQCTWGMSCRFLHPGVTDKGNYTMFESLVRSVPMQGGSAGASAPAAASSSAAARAGGSAYSSHASASADYHDYRNERPPLHHRPALLHAPSIYGAHVHDARTLLPDGAPVVVENAWERGLRTAKEMMRKANKRKEQDMDFEDKKMNLTLSPDEMEKDSYYLKDRGGSSARSPPPPSASVREQPLNPLSMPMSMHPHAVPHANPRALLPLQYSVYGPPPDRYGRSQYMPPQYEDVDAYGRMARYRELPPHRMPHYEDDRRSRPTREVIVQRVEAAGRGDEWSDPWMRSKSIDRGSYDREERRRRDRRSYSSNSSYSTSNSSQSDSSSDSSRSSSPSDHKRRYGGSSHKLATGAATTRRHGGRAARSPSQIPRRPRHTSKGSLSPSYKRPALDKRGVGHSPASKRKKLSSPAPKKFDKLRRRRSSSTSDSDSSDTSYSESDSGSSSSDSSSGSRDTPQKRVRATDKALNERKLIKKPAEQATKKRSPISIEIKKTSNMVGVSALASPNNSADSDKEKEHGNGKDKEKDHVKDKDKDGGKEKDKDKDGGKDKDGKKSRREELLKQLRAVEDAIAKKRSKLN
ncbi:zinc finger CCCH domain-containing protein 18 [Drosophila santomea]|uniref:zinc finger CCCH domain-containing protein 18 n=1 Tax=Drosophila santomea TaxID=129105 RepID=UPI0019543701|nr:zinc finger CCCH domain-containing protein 18 [Drosophila santomea]